MSGSARDTADPLQCGTPTLSFFHVPAGKRTSNRALAALATRYRRGLPGGDAVLEIDPVARGYAQQIGGAPNDVVLEFADLTVGVNQFPHHLDDAQAPGLVDRTHDDAGEMKEVD